jgi:hypothetical protein
MTLTAVAALPFLYLPVLIGVDVAMKAVAIIASSAGLSTTSLTYSFHGWFLSGLSDPLGIA